MTGASPVTTIHSAAWQSHADWRGHIVVTGLAPVMPFTKPFYELVGFDGLAPVMRTALGLITCSLSCLSSCTFNVSTS